MMQKVMWQQEQKPGNVLQESSTQSLAFIKAKIAGFILDRFGIYLESTFSAAILSGNPPNDILKLERQQMCLATVF